MSITGVTSSSDIISFFSFGVGRDFVEKIGTSFSYSTSFDVIMGFVNETANDGSADGAYASLLSEAPTFGNGTGTDNVTIDMSSAFFKAHVGATIVFEVVLQAFNSFTGFDGQAIYDIEFKLDPFPIARPSIIQNDFLGITRLVLPLDQAETEANAINAATTTEIQYVNDLLWQVANTTIPAVAVEGSMYGAVGTSAEITKLVIEFLPLQVENAIQNGFNPQVYACEALGLVFAFGDENGGRAFANNFGPSNAAMPATHAGDMAFAAAAASTIFGADANANTPGAILGFVSNWVAFYTSVGIPGFARATADQIDLAARGAAWGDAVGIALANNLGPLVGQTTNFLEDAARAGAIYSASLASQPNHAPFQGEKSASVANAADHAQLIGIAASDHIVM